MDTKQIFDWLREQINREKVSEYDKEDASFNLGLNNAISKVYRAEAKWEAEVCEKDFAQRIRTVIPLLEVNMLYGTVSLLKDLADAVGIKISEVE